MQAAFIPGKVQEAFFVSERTVSEDISKLRHIPMGCPGAETEAQAGRCNHKRPEAHAG